MRGSDGQSDSEAAHGFGVHFARGLERVFETFPRFGPTGDGDIVIEVSQCDV